jgi:hypothetical protein
MRKFTIREDGYCFGGWMVPARVILPPRHVSWAGADTRIDLVKRTRRIPVPSLKVGVKQPTGQWGGWIWPPRAHCHPFPDVQRDMQTKHGASEMLGCDEYESGWRIERCFCLWDRSTCAEPRWSIQRRGRELRSPILIACIGNCRSRRHCQYTGGTIMETLRNVRARLR